MIGAALALLLAASVATAAETLLTLDGRILEGTGRFEAGRVVFVQRTGPTVRLELADVLLWKRHTSSEPPAPAARPSSALAATRPPSLAQGVRFRSGEAVVGTPTAIVDGRLLLTLADGPAQREVAFPVSDVFEIIFPPSVSGSPVSGPSVSGSPVSGPSVSGPSVSGPSVSGPSASGPLPRGPETLPGVADAMPSRFVGARLAGGDLIEGELAQLTADRIVLRSVLFGERSFPRPGPVVSVRLAGVDVTPDQRGTLPPEWRVRLADGTVVHADRLTFAAAGDRLRLADRAGRVHEPGPEQLVELGRPRRVRASDAGRLLGPAALPSALPPRLRGHAPWADLAKAADDAPLADQPVGRPVLPGDGGAVHLELDGATAVYCRLGVPEGLLPGRRVRFAIELDGRRAATTPAVSSIDAPLRVALNTAGKRTLTFRLLSEPGELRPVEGVVADLMEVVAP
ncbi:MAG: hypothetical protein ACK4PI_09375 [Tepidisphaerales bacterium]